MLKRGLILLGLLLSFTVAPAYAADVAGDAPIFVIAQDAHDDDTPDTGLPVTQTGQVNTNNAVGNTSTAPCGVSGQGPCTQQGSGGVSTVNGMPNGTTTANCGVGGQGPCAKPGAGGVNAATGLPDNVKQPQCGVGGQGACAKSGPGGVNLETGKVIPSK